MTNRWGVFTDKEISILHSCVNWYDIAGEDFPVMQELQDEWKYRESVQYRESLTTACEESS